MKTEPVLMVRHVRCPSCGEPQRADYVDKNREYTWWCNNEKCGWQFRFTIAGDTVQSEPTGTRTERVFVLLDDGKGVQFVSEGTRFWKDGRLDIGITAYGYEEHQCESNLMRNVEEVIVDGVPDPHGWLTLRGWATKAACEEAMATGNWDQVEWSPPEG